MKKLFVLFALVVSLSAAGQEMKKDPKDGCPMFEMPDGDTVWTMKQYYMVIYLAGGNRTQDSATAAAIQKGHLDFIGRMGKEGLLSIAGPFGDAGNMRGVLIFNVSDVRRVEELMQQDPAVQSGRLVFEIHPWWAAKGSKLN